MEIWIQNEKTVGQLRQEFFQAFELLKIAFFTKPHRAFKSSHSKFMISDALKTLGEIRDTAHQNEGRLCLEPTMPVWQVERLFEEEFGLHVQVFRKSGSKWLETSVTDDLSLEAQIALAQASENKVIPINDPMDYREQD